MRSQCCTIQQALTPEAAAIVKQAMVLAKQRGHAQVTPLHVAHIMLSLSSGSFRAACLQSHAHPLQCRALELCFNVALNRLPHTTSAPVPTIANALVAAFKRAQANQRRGSIENQQQQQPLLVVKVELKQLIISILDDPSISRVMREAGFSSTMVKEKIDVMDQPRLVKIMVITEKPISVLSNHDEGGVRKEDVERVIDSIVTTDKRKRNSVLVGECLATLESLVKEVMHKIENGAVPEVLKRVKFVNLSFSIFAHLSREEVDQRIGEIKILVNNNGGLIIYFDDLQWANEFRATTRNDYYCPIEHMIMEIGKLVMSYVEYGKLWLLGIATFQTYIRCQTAHPSLETLWALHAITIPVDSLRLSLISHTEEQNPWTNKRSEVSGSGNRLMLDGGRDGGGKLGNTETPQSSPCSTPTTTSLPPWLQQYKDANIKPTSTMNYDKDNVAVKDVWKQWSRISTSSMQISPTLISSPSFERSLSCSSLSPCSSTSNFSYDPLKWQHTNNEQTNKVHEPILFTMSAPNSTSSSDVNEAAIDESNCGNKLFKEYNDYNLRTLCNALERKVPRQKHIIFDIASTILQCRSGSYTRRMNTDDQGDFKEDTWLFFQGFDVEAKVSIAREIAKFVFGSEDKFASIGRLSSFSSNKRIRDEHIYNRIYIDKFGEAVSRDPHRVFFIDDIDQLDYRSQMGIKKAIERGKITNHTRGVEVCFRDAIIILSSERFSSRSRVHSPSTKSIVHVLPQEAEPMIMNKGDDAKEITSPNCSLDLNISINDENLKVEKARSIDEIGLLATVDRCIDFTNCQEL